MSEQVTFSSYRAAIRILQDFEDKLDYRKIAYDLAAERPDLFARYAQPQIMSQENSDQYIYEQVKEVADQGQKIGAIKRHRELTGSGIKEAKEYVEARFRFTPRSVQ